MKWRICGSTIAASPAAAAITIANGPQRMKAIGLHPSSTGKEGGQETGDSVGHYIVPDGPFDGCGTRAADAGFSITWTEKPPPRSRAPVEDEREGSDRSRKKPKSGKRVKYTCPTCRLNAWAKDRVQLLCGGRHDADGTCAIEDAIKNATPTDGRRRALLRSVALRRELRSRLVVVLHRDRA